MKELSLWLKNLEGAEVVGVGEKTVGLKTGAQDRNEVKHRWWSE